MSATPHDASPKVMMQPPTAMAPLMCAIDVDLNADPIGVGDEGSGSLSGRKRPRELSIDSLPLPRNLFDRMPAPEEELEVTPEDGAISEQAAMLMDMLIFEGRGVDLDETQSQDGRAFPEEDMGGAGADADAGYFVDEDGVMHGPGAEGD